MRSPRRSVRSAPDRASRQGRGTAFSEAVTSGAYWSKVAAHAAAGGTLNALNDGDFGHAFIAAGVTEAANPAIDTIADGAPEGRTLRILASAMVGGTVSHLVGGNFGNGAITGAFQRAFNADGNHCGEQCLEEQTYRDNMQTRLRLGLSGAKDGAEGAGVVVEEGYWYAITGAIGRILGLGSRTSNAARLGREGEDAAGIAGRKVRIPSPTNTARFRVPDELAASYLREIKNVSELRVTSQLRDFAAYAREHELQMIINVRPSTTIGPAAQSFINEHRIQVIRELAPLR